MAQEEKSLSDVTGKGIKIEIRGKEYELSVLTIDDLAEFESYIKSQRLRSFLEATEGLDEKIRIEGISKITSMHLTPEEMTEEMRSISGTRFFLWCSLRKKNPDIKLEEMGKLVDLDNLGEITTIINSIGGKAVKNRQRGKAGKS